MAETPHDNVCGWRGLVLGYWLLIGRSLTPELQRKAINNCEQIKPFFLLCLALACLPASLGALWLSALKSFFFLHLRLSSILSFSTISLSFSPRLLAIKHINAFDLAKNIYLYIECWSFIHIQTLLCYQITYTLLLTLARPFFSLRRTRTNYDATYIKELPSSFDYRCFSSPLLSANWSQHLNIFFAKIKSLDFFVSLIFDSVSNWVCCVPFLSDRIRCRRR